MSIRKNEKSLMTIREEIKQQLGYTDEQMDGIIAMAKAGYYEVDKNKKSKF